jgi:hypothetical protein
MGALQSNLPSGRQVDLLLENDQSPLPLVRSTIRQVNPQTLTFKLWDESPCFSCHPRFSGPCSSPHVHFHLTLLLSLSPPSSHPSSFHPCSDSLKRISPSNQSLPAPLGSIHCLLKHDLLLQSIPPLGNLLCLQTSQSLHLYSSYLKGLTCSSNHHLSLAPLISQPNTWRITSTITLLTHLPHLNSIPTLQY